MSFDQKARDWDKDPKKVERAKIFAAEIINILGGADIKSALELGSGTGLVSFQLKERFREITLADTSGGMTEVLKEKIEAERLAHFTPLLITDTTDLLSHPQTDVVYTLLTLHHIKDLDSAFMVFSKIIRKGGYLFIGDLVPEDGTFHNNDPGFDGHPGFDVEELKTRLAKEGFETLAEKILLSLTREIGGVTKYYPLFMLALKKK